MLPCQLQDKQFPLNSLVLFEHVFGFRPRIRPRRIEICLLNVCLQTSVPRKMAWDMTCESAVVRILNCKLNLELVLAINKYL